MIEYRTTVSSSINNYRQFVANNSVVFGNTKKKELSMMYFHYLPYIFTRAVHEVVSSVLSMGASSTSIVRYVRTCRY